MCAWTCRNMHRRAHTWKKVASNSSDICTQPALVIFHPIWFMHIFQLWLPPPPAPPLWPFLSLSCALLGPVMCLYVNDRHISGWVYGCNYKEFMISALTCFHLLYSQLYSIYIPCAYQLAVPTESVTNWKLKVKNSYLKSAEFSCSELRLRYCW